MTPARKLSTLVGLAAVGYTVAARPRILRWGATDEEVRQPYPGAEIIPGGKRGATTAVTIQAPPSEVWPWLVQTGCDRASWYSWDRLDNGGVPSADRIHPEWQRISIGDHLSSKPDGSAWFEVAALEPQRFLALRASLDLRGHPFDSGTSRPRHFTDSVWCFLLKEIPGDSTRVVVSGYATGRPRPLLTIANLLFWEPAHLIMQTRQFANLRRRLEGDTSRSSLSASTP
jgi:proline iminopeptidase